MSVPELHTLRNQLMTMKYSEFKGVKYPVRAISDYEHGIDRGTRMV
jgi:hypothetical protein